MIRWSLNEAIGFVLYRPRLASTCAKILTLFPSINEKLLSFASNEDITTNDNGPVPKEAKGVYREVKTNTLLRGFEEDHLIEGTGHEHYKPRAAKPKGKNHEQKSPLENGSTELSAL
jgi:hypothetical protein